ncbi:MAG: YciI family protein [Actinomycetota bacterium]|nr:YciI family protein [Actinomycetota bacterium]
MPIYAVQYVYDPYRNADRDTHRPEHRAYLQSLADQGSMLVRGPYSDDGAPGALLVLRAESPDAVAAALDPDPFNREGLIIDRIVREWSPIGNDVFG